MVDGKPRIGDEVYIHGYIDEIRNDVVIIRNEGGYFGTSDRGIFYYEEDERGYGTMNEADRKDENCSEKPNIGIGCSRCGVRFGCIDRDMPHAVHCNNYGKITDEPQTDKWSHDCIGCGNNDTCEFAFTDAVKICRYINEPQAEGSE